jgi:hypothetical protein
MSEYDPETLKLKLINWLHLAVQNGYGSVYFKNPFTIPEGTAIGALGLRRDLAQEDNWTRQTKNIFENFKDNLGQSLEPSLRIHAYGAASTSPSRDRLEGSYELAMQGAINRDSDVAERWPEFARWYLDVFVPSATYLLASETKISYEDADTEMVVEYPAGERLKSAMLVSHNIKNDAILPGALVAVPKGSEDYFTYMVHKGGLESAAIAAVEETLGDIDTYTGQALEQGSTLKMDEIEKEYMLARSTYVGETLHSWRLGLPLAGSLKRYDLDPDDNLYDVRRKVDPYYIVGDPDIDSIGAIQHVVEYGIGTVNDATWADVNEISANVSPPLPYIDVDNVPKILEKSQDIYTPWHETKFNTINLIYKFPGTSSDIGLINQVFEALNPIDLRNPHRLPSAEPASSTPDPDGWDTPAAVARNERLTNLLNNMLGTGTTQIMESIRDSLVGYPGANKLQQFLESGVNDADDSIRTDMVLQGKKIAATYLLKFFDKWGSPGLSSAANIAIVEHLKDHMFIVNRFLNQGGDLCFHMAIHRSYLDVIPRHPHRMELYEKTYGEGSYYGGFYEQKIPLATFAAKLTAFKQALQKVDKKWKSDGKKDLMDSSTASFSLYDDDGFEPSQFQNFEMLVKEGSPIQGELAKFLDANEGDAAPVGASQLFADSAAKLVFIYDQRYKLKGVYAIATTREGPKKIPLKMGFDKFVHSEACSAQNISFISNMDNIIEETKAPNPKTPKEFIQKYILLPPQFKKPHEDEMGPGVKTAEELSREEEYLATPSVQRLVAAAAKKKRHFAGSKEFASLERTAAWVKSVNDGYQDILARYGIKGLTRQLTQCLMELVGMNWSCETKLGLALSALGDGDDNVEKFRQVILVPAVQLGAISARTLATGYQTQNAKSDEALRKVKLRDQQAYNIALQRIDSSYGSLSAAALTAEFQQATAAQKRLGKFDKDAQYRDETEAQALAGANYIQELSKQTDLEEICKKLEAFLMQLIQYLLNPDMQDDDLSYGLPKNPKWSLPRFDLSKEDLYEEAVKAATTAAEKIWADLLSNLLQTTLKMLHMICQMLLQDLASPGIEDEPPLSPDDLAALLDRLFPSGGLPLPGASAPGAAQAVEQMSALIEVLVSLLTPSQLCMLLDGSASVETLQMILDKTADIPALAPLFTDLAAVREVFKELGKLIDPTYCEGLLGVTDEQLVDLCNLPPDIFPPELRNELQDALDEYSRFTQIAPKGPSSILGDPCDPVVPSERPEGAPPPPEPEKALLDWKNIPVMAEANDTAINIFYEDTRDRFSSAVPNTLNHLVPIVEGTAEEGYVLTAADEAEVEKIVADIASSPAYEKAAATQTRETETSVSAGNVHHHAEDPGGREIITQLGRSGPTEEDYVVAKKVYIANKLQALKRAPGFISFVTPTRKLDPPGTHGGGLDSFYGANTPRADVGSDVPWTLLHIYYTGQPPEDYSLTLPDVEFLAPALPNTHGLLGPESAVAPYAPGTFVGFEIKFMQQARDKAPPLDRTAAYIRSADERRGTWYGSLFHSMNPMHFELPTDPNFVLSSMIPSEEFQLNYPGNQGVKKLSDHFKAAAFTPDYLPGVPGFLPHGGNDDGLEFKVTPYLTVVDVAQSSSVNTDNFMLSYQKITKVTQPGVPETEAGIADVRKYVVKYHDYLPGPDLFGASAPARKDKMFFDYIDSNLAAKGFNISAARSSVGDSSTTRAVLNQDYRQICRSYVHNIVQNTQESAPFLAGADLTNIEFLPLSDARLQRSRGYMRKRTLGTTDDGLPKYEYIKIPSNAPHGDLLSLNALKDKVKDEFQKNPVCDPMGDPNAKKGMSELAGAAVLGIIYLVMRVYSVEFLLKIYPLITRYRMLDIFRSNVVPLYITQRLKMEISKDKAFYCDFVEQVKKVMRDRKNRGDQALKSDPIGGQPIEISSVDDMLVFLLKEQIPALIQEFDFILKEHAAIKTSDGSPLPSGWEVFTDEGQHLKKDAEELLVLNKILEVPRAQIVEPMDTNLEEDGDWHSTHAKKHGGFFFQRYVRVVGKPSPPGQVSNELAEVIQNRSSSRVSGQTLERSLSGDVEAFTEVLEQIRVPDLYGVVNYNQWNRFWENQALPVLERTQRRSNLISDYFDRLALGVRLVYMPPSQRITSETAGMQAADNSFKDVWNAQPASAAEISKEEKAYRIYESSPLTAASVETTMLPLFESEKILLDHEYNLQSTLGNWGEGEAATRIFRELKESIEASDDYKLLTEYIFPVDRLYGTAFLGLDLLVSTMYKETDNSFDPPKAALKKLFYVLTSDDPLDRCKDPSISDALYGLDWDKILEALGYDAKQMAIDTAIAMIVAVLNILGATMLGGVAMMILKLLLCPIIPTTKDNELLGPLGERFKEEWGCFTLPFPPWPDIPGSYADPSDVNGGSGACPSEPIALDDKDDCAAPPRYASVYINDPWDEILMPRESLKDAEGVEVFYNTRRALEAAQRAMADESE